MKLSLFPHGERGPLPRGVILRYYSNSFNYEWYDTSCKFRQLSANNIRADGAWHTIVLGLTPRTVTLLEDGNYKFTWNVDVPDTVNPTFDMQMLDKGGSLDIDIGSVYAIPANVDDNLDD